jgi:ER-bound oxygenase mpaB/B'/Rubber oxygenase, catalytic domain
MTSASVIAGGAWTDAILDASRKVGDPIGDAAIREIFERKESHALNAFMGQMVANDEMPDNMPDGIERFLRETSQLPHWACPKRIREAERLFNIYGLVSMIALVCASLPQCYTMRTGVRILDLTGQLGEHTNRRLHQTAVMVLAVMGRQGLQDNGRGIRQAQKVRLIHAAIRYRILGAIGGAGVPASAGAQIPAVVPGAVRSVNDVIGQHRFDWRIERDGYPINQEDLAFTLLTFGLVIPRGMRTLGVDISDDEFTSFLHAWNVVGFVMGVDEALMGHTPEEAAVLFERIKARQAGPSPAGSRLTDALLGVMERDVLRFRPIRPLAPILLRILVGDETAAVLGLNTRHGWVVRLCHRAIACVFRGMNAVATRLFARARPLKFVSARLGRRFVDLLVEVTYGKKGVQLEIPPGWR